MDIREVLKRSGVVPVIVIEDETKAVPLARALVKGGLGVLDIPVSGYARIVWQ